MLVFDGLALFRLRRHNRQNEHRTAGGHPLLKFCSWLQNFSNGLEALVHAAIEASARCPQLAVTAYEKRKMA